MLITFLGTRGTHPSSGQGTMSFIVDNKIVFDLCPEFVISNKRFIESWMKTNGDEELNEIKKLYGKPSFSKLEHIFLSHFHYDHWGGLRHLLIYLQMFDNNRSSKPLNIYISKESMNIFKKRMSELFNISLSEFSAHEFFLRYLLIEIDTSIVDLVKIHEIESGTKIKIGKYSIEPYATTHMTGSLAFKLTSTRYKLIEDALKKFDLPKGPLLGQLQRNGNIIFNNVEIKDSDVFKIEKTILGYSSDTKVDPDLIDFFQDSTILLHESSYLTDDDEYHTDSHSSLDDLVKKITNYSIKLFSPVHFSGRYKWDEIKTAINTYNKNISKMDIYAPKFGDIIYYDEKSKDITIKTLELNDLSY